MIKKLLATGALAGALLLTGGTMAAAGPLPYTGAEVDTDTVVAGGEVCFTSDATDLEPGTPIDVTVTPSAGVTVSGEVVVDENGTFTFCVTTPANAAPGTTYTGTATGTDTDGDTYSFGYTVTIAAAPADGAPAGGGGAALPITGGADTTAVLWFGAGALALGGAAIAVAAVTRRKSAQI